MTRRPADGPLRPERLRPPRRGLPRSWWRLVRGGLAFLVATIVLNALVGERGVFETMRVKREQQALAASIAALRRENGELADQIRRLKSDRRAVEEAARRDLGYLRKDEVVFLIKDVPAPGAVDQPAPASKQLPGPAAR
jgi:cell division protein FtsB/cell division protein DivIC